MEVKRGKKGECLLRKSQLHKANKRNTSLEIEFFPTGAWQFFQSRSMSFPH